MDTTMITSLTEFFTTLIGDIPPEMEGLFYIICVIVLLFIINMFFNLLFVVFGVTKWRH